MWRKSLRHEKRHVHNQYELTTRFLCIAQLYMLYPIFDIIQKYITGYHMLKSSHMFLVLISSTFVSNLYGLIRSILCFVCIGPYCIVTVPLVQHWVITNGPLYGVSYLYAALLLSITLSFLGILYLRLGIHGQLFTVFVDYIFINVRLISLTY